MTWQSQLSVALSDVPISCQSDTALMLTTTANDAVTHKTALSCRQEAQLSQTGRASAVMWFKRTSSQSTGWCANYATWTNILTNRNTLCSKKHVTTFVMISWTRTVRLQRLLAYILGLTKNIGHRRVGLFLVSHLTYLVQLLYLGNCRYLNLALNCSFFQCYNTRKLTAKLSPYFSCHWIVGRVVSGSCTNSDGHFVSVLPDGIHNRKCHHLSQRRKQRQLLYIFIHRQDGSTVDIYTSLFARKAAATSEKSTKHTTKTNKQKRKKTTLKSGRLVNSVTTNEL